MGYPTMGVSSAGKRGLLFMLVGPGGVGKNALLQELLLRLPDLCQLPTATTRPPRSGEIHGIHHYFVSLAEFQEMIAANALLEYQEVHPGKFYGVPRDTVEEMVANHQYRIADIEFKGATIIRKAYPANSIAIFVAPPTYESLLKRLNDRKATPEQISERLARLDEEMPYASQCDYVIINDDMSAAVDELHAIVLAEQDQTPGSSYRPAPQVTYHVEIWPLFGDQIMTNNKTDSRVPIAQFLRGENPDNAAWLALTNALPLDPPTEDIQYGTPEASRPVVFDYDPDNNRYSLTFRYTYKMDELLVPPKGWNWMPLDTFRGS